MTFELFKKQLDSYKKCLSNIHILHDMGFNLLDGKYSFICELEDLFISPFKLIYNKEGLDWIDWFIYDNEFGEGDLEAYDENKNVIADSYESLYKLLENDTYKL